MPFLGQSAVVGNGTKVQFANVPAGATTPTAHAITVTANATQGATSISLTANPSGVVLQHDTPIYFNNGVIAYVNTATADTITVSTATAVPVRPLSAAVATTNTATAYALRRLNGIRTAGVPIAPQPEDIFTMDDGFGIVQQVVGVERTINIDGIRKTGDRCMYEIIIPYLTSDTTIRNFLWADLLYPNGDRFYGLVRITGGNGFANAAVRQSMTYQMTMSFQGDTGFFYSNTVEQTLLAP